MDKNTLLIKIFTYFAFIFTVLGILETSRDFGSLTVLEPGSYLRFSGLCLLFAIALNLQRLVEKLSK